MKAIAISFAALLGVLPLAAQNLAPPAQPSAQSSTQTPSAASASSLSPEQIQVLQEHLTDWAQLGRYRAENAALPPVEPDQQRVVFYGDSITDAWGHGADFFPGKPYVNRGISGQTTPQMLVRFQQDVVALQPKVVVILAGTNDIARNTGPATLRMIQDNIQAMTELAQLHGIKVVLCSVTPIADYGRALELWQTLAQLERQAMVLNRIAGLQRTATSQTARSDPGRTPPAPSSEHDCPRLSHSDGMSPAWRSSGSSTAPESSCRRC